MKDYEILLFEFRQGLKDVEKHLKSLNYIKINDYRRLNAFKKLIEAELSKDQDENQQLIRLIEG